MNPFTYSRPDSVASAVTELLAEPAAKIIGGGTNLIDLMKENIDRPSRLVDINRLPLTDIVELPDGGLRLGALATNADTAYHPLVKERYPLLSETILAGASPQLRNMATNGGNLFQRTRCYYFYDNTMPCNKRSPGSGCAAIGGYNRIHAILGTELADQSGENPQTACIATYPSDMAVALAALEAVVRVEGPDGERTLAFADFHRLPGDKPQLDNTLQPGEIVTAIDLPPAGFAQHHTYLKLRDRASYAFALVSVAVGLELDRNAAGKVLITKARLALGGVAHKPWRKPEAEELLVGKEAVAENFWPVAESLLAGAKGYGHNTFKIDLAKRAVVRALSRAAGIDRPIA